jgi:ABC-type nickel/cobalt efflux system permease component RcnA
MNATFIFKVTTGTEAAMNLIAAVLGISCTGWWNVYDEYEELFDDEHTFKVTHINGRYVRVEFVDEDTYHCYVSTRDLTHPKDDKLFSGIGIDWSQSQINYESSVKLITEQY